MIEEFKIRANYPNLNLLKMSVFNRLYNKKLTDLIGYLPPEIEYRISGNDVSEEIKVRYEDIFFLCCDRNEEALKHLRLIIASRRGDKQAKDNLKKISLDYLQKIDNFYRPIKFYEDDYVIPSMSEKNYNAKLISDKGVALLNLSQEGYPVPDFCILTAKFHLLNETQREPYVKLAITNLENMTRQYLSSEDSPLVFALRCAMPQYLPGLMPTYLNVGVTSESYRGLLKLYETEVADKIYVNNLKTIYSLLFPSPRISPDQKMSEDLKEVIDFYRKKISSKDPRLLSDPFYQILFFINQARNFYQRNQDLLFTFVKNERHYPSLILQKMVWTVRYENSYPGVLYSHHSRTGLGSQIVSVRNIFGEDIMTGMANTDDTEYFDRQQIKLKFPEVYHFDPLLNILEKKLESPVTIEFAAESTHDAHFFAVLQLNPSAVTGRAILLSAIAMHNNSIISKRRVIELIQPYHITQIFSDRIDDRSFGDLAFFCKGVSILPRTAVSAKAYFSADKALEAKKKGYKVCFCKENFLPSDTIVMAEVDAIISLTPAAIHVVTACRGYGVPAFLNLEEYGVKLKGNCLVNSENSIINEGDWITVSSKRAKIFLGRARYTPARFRKYLDGEKFKLEPKEARVFTNMARAFGEYQDLIRSLQYEEIVDINDLVKLIQTDLKNQPEQAREFLNSWFDSNTDRYVRDVLKSELGTHQDQHSLYKMLTLDRKINFFQLVIQVCLDRKISGFNAGSFMLGRFICLPHPVEFWRSFGLKELGFLLNEYVLFEKYLQLLHDVGERKLNRARKRILNEDYTELRLNISKAQLFTSLKLIFKDWSKLGENLPENHANATKILIELLELPFGELYDYDKSWSYNILAEICKKQQIPIPKPNEI